MKFKERLLCCCAVLAWFTFVSSFIALSIYLAVDAGKRSERKLHTQPKELIVSNNDIHKIAERFEKDQLIPKLQKMAGMALHAAPLFFKVEASPIKKSGHNCSAARNRQVGRGCCDVGYVIGSYKSGVSSLVAMLRNKAGSSTEFDPSSGLVHTSQHPCLHLPDSSPETFTGCESCPTPGSRRPLLLDTCPHYTGKFAESIFCSDPRARLVMLLRDPFDRLVSQYNHQLRSQGLKRGIDEGFLTEKRNLQYSNYFEMLSAYLRLFPAEQILLVQSDALSVEPEKAITAVRRHLGLKPRSPAGQFWLHKTAHWRKEYRRPNVITTNETLRVLQSMNERFFRLVNYHFAWKTLP